MLLRKFLDEDIDIFIILKHTRVKGIEYELQKIYTIGFLKKQLYKIISFIIVSFTPTWYNILFTLKISH